MSIAAGKYKPLKNSFINHTPIKIFMWNQKDVPSKKYDRF